MKNDPTLKRWFREYNKKFFDGLLPNAVVFWEPPFVTDDVLGMLTEDKGIFVIRIDPSIKFSTALTRIVLLHEQAHLRIWPYNGHGKRFYGELLRLVGLGAYRNLL